MTPATIGFIGIGVMGRPMAIHLLEAGYRVAVYARRSDAAAPLVTAGATLAGSPRELASRSNVVITVVTATADVEQVLLGDNGVIAGAKPGTIVIDMSTIAPQATQRIAATLGAKKIRMLDAPVTGGPVGAEAGTLTIMVGGDVAVLDEVRPILERLGRQIVHMGGHGAGQVAKACNQLALLVNAEGVAEALTLGQRYGLDPQALRQAMSGGIAASRVLDVFGQRMAERQFAPGIQARLYDKDLKIALDLAAEVRQPLPAAAVVREHMDELVERGGSNDDLSAIIRVVERTE